jgi:biopolymer transport protein TolR
LLDADRVLELVSAVIRREPERPVVVKADTTVQYGRVVEGMALLQQAGAQKVGFATQSPGTSPRKSGTR